MGSNGIFSDFLGDLLFTSWDFSWGNISWLIIVFIFLTSNLTFKYSLLFLEIWGGNWYWNWLWLITFLRCFWGFWLWCCNCWSLWFSSCGLSLGSSDSDWSRWDCYTFILLLFLLNFCLIFITTWESHNSCLSFLLSRFLSYLSFFNSCHQLLHLSGRFIHNLGEFSINFSTILGGFGEIFLGIANLFGECCSFTIKSCFLWFGSWGSGSFLKSFKLIRNLFHNSRFLIELFLAFLGLSGCWCLLLLNNNSVGVEFFLSISLLLSSLESFFLSLNNLLSSKFFLDFILNSGDCAFNINDEILDVHDLKLNCLDTGSEKIRLLLSGHFCGEEFILLLNFSLNRCSKCLDFSSQIINLSLSDSSTFSGALGSGSISFLSTECSKNLLHRFSLGELKLIAWLCGDNLGLDTCELSGEAGKIGLECSLLTCDLGLLFCNFGHDRCELGDCFLRSLDDSVNNSFSLWCFITEFADKNFFLSGLHCELGS